MTIRFYSKSQKKLRVQNLNVVFDFLAPAAAAAGGAAAAPAAKKKVEVEEEEEDDDMGFGLFD